MPGVPAEKAPPGPADRRWRSHWPLLVVLVVAALLILPNLGRDYLWADEGDTAVLARNILQFGVPRAWDGVSLIDSDYGARLNDDLVMVSHPWLQYYVTAASFALVGVTAFGARLPFALLGLLTVGLIYGLTWRATANRWTAASATLLVIGGGDARRHRHRTAGRES
jgi:4-amino-4-deoxy-L-arabinose transferase-like glycosyltransferase